MDNTCTGAEQCAERVRQFSRAGAQVIKFTATGEVNCTKVAIEPVWFLPEWLPDWGLWGSVSPETVETHLMRDPHIRALVLTAFGDGESIQFALENGADGFALKTAPPRQTVDAIEQFALPPRIPRIDMIEDRLGAPPEAADPTTSTPPCPTSSGLR